MALAAVVARPTDQDTDDLDLVAGVRAGDERAFELLYLRYHGRIAAYVRSMVHDHGRAEDITQEVFISAFRRMRETDRDIAFKPWMYEIAKNACIDAFRRSRHCNEVSFDAHGALGAGDHDRLAGMGAAPAPTPATATVAAATTAFDQPASAPGSRPPATLADHWATVAWPREQSSWRAASSSTRWRTIAGSGTSAAIFAAACRSDGRDSRSTPIASA